MTHRVVTHSLARRDVRSIVEWLHARSRAGAISWFAAYEAALRRIKAAPAGYSRLEESEFFPGRDLRQFLFKTRRGRVYRGVFEIRGRDVLILRVLGPGQDWLGAEDIDET